MGGNRKKKKYVPLLDRYSSYNRGSRSVYRSSTGAILSSDQSPKKKRNSWNSGGWR